MGQTFSKVVDAPPRNHTILPLVNFMPWRRYSPASPPVVRVVVEKKGRLYLIPVNITNVDSVQAVVEKIRAAREEALHHIYMLGLLHNAFWGQRIALATLCTVC